MSLRNWIAVLSLLGMGMVLAGCRLVPLTETETIPAGQSFWYYFNQSEPGAVRVEFTAEGGPVNAALMTIEDGNKVKAGTDASGVKPIAIEKDTQRGVLVMNRPPGTYAVLFQSSAGRETRIKLSVHFGR